MQQDQNIIQIPEFYNQKFLSSLQQDGLQYNYLLLKINGINYLIHISVKLQDTQYRIPNRFQIKQTTSQFQIISNKQSLKQKTLKTISNEQIYQVVRNYCIINIMFAGVEGQDYQIIGYRYGQIIYDSKQLINKFLEICQRVQEQSNNIYNKTSKKSTKNNKLNICDMLPMLQFSCQAIISPINIKSNQFIHRKYFSHQISLLINRQKVSCQKQDYLEQFEKICTQAVVSQRNSMYVNPHQYFQNVTFIPQKIYNPHLFSKPISKPKYQLYLVKGAYEYYHYGDQKFTDIGWGCAYRAFQTLLSWMHFQGYTKQMKQMITINQIQQNIDACDRSRRLKGKNDWIGATQISWLIPKMTSPSINCKILHLSDGKQILDKCQQLKNHFLTVGCPVMYGGGEYAYSIVGMYYNWKLGECQFLILDPHYTGQDQYSKIVDKKGLAWRKPQQMFKKGIFYNFCLPIIK